MKKILFLLAVAITFAACKKDNQPKSQTGNIVGTWELRTYTTGWTMPENYEAGNGDKYIFKANGTYVKYLNNSVEKQGKYTLTATGEQEGTKFGKITLTNPDYTDVYSIKDDHFSIGSSLADGPSWLYLRIQ